MKCMVCGGDTEVGGTGGAYARCQRCGYLFAKQGEAWAPLMPAHGGIAPDHAQAEALGFAPRETDNERKRREDPGIARHENVGGVPLLVDRAGVRVDQSRLAAKIERKIDQKISQTITGLWMGALFFVLFLGAFGWGAWFIYSKVTEAMDERGKPSKNKVAHDEALSDWDGKEPFTCGGVDEVVIKKVKAKLDGETAITVSANCKLSLVDVDLDAEVGILARGNGEVTIKGGSIKGSKAAIVAEANATVTGKGTEVSGAKKPSGHGHIDVK
jgi:hypothetical protein